MAVSLLLGEEEEDDYDEEDEDKDDSRVIGSLKTSPKTRIGILQ